MRQIVAALFQSVNCYASTQTDHSTPHMYLTHAIVLQIFILVPYGSKLAAAYWNDASWAQRSYDQNGGGAASLPAPVVVTVLQPAVKQQPDPKLEEVPDPEPKVKQESKPEVTPGTGSEMKPVSEREPSEEPKPKPVQTSTYELEPNKDPKAKPVQTGSYEGEPMSNPVQTGSYEGEPNNNDPKAKPVQTGSNTVVYTTNSVARTLRASMEQTRELAPASVSLQDTNSPVQGGQHDEELRNKQSDNYPDSWDKWKKPVMYGTVSFVVVIGVTYYLSHK